MSNSSLVEFSQASPNRYSPRRHAIDTITIHCFVGQVNVQRMAKSFCSAANKKSPNYGVDLNGTIALFVDEADCSWCTSSRSNDDRAITIECACDSYEPYAINNKVYQSLIKLCADICKRNDIKELRWEADKSLIGQVDRQNMTVHRWFAAKSCPGNYIYNRLGQIAKDVNEVLNGSQKWYGSVPFKVKITATQLKIRSGPGTNYSYKTHILPGIYTIVEVQEGQGSKRGFGKLKSGAGWISLDYAEVRT